MSTRSILNRRPHPPLHIDVRRRVLLVAHPTRADELLSWARARRDVLHDLRLFADEATRAALPGELGLQAAGLHSWRPQLHGGRARRPGHRRRAPDLLVLFWDPSEAHPRDPGVRALLRSAVQHGAQLACTTRTADFLVLTSLPHEELAPLLPHLDERTWAPELVWSRSGEHSAPCVMPR